MAHRPLDRTVVGILEAMGRRMWGFPPQIMALVVAEMGATGAALWFARNMPRFLHTRRVLGPLRTHLACIAVSLHNSCTYCAYGHAYALELLYLRDRGRLFPLDAATLASWLDLEPRELADRLHKLLEDAGMHAEVLWVDRTIGLATGTYTPVDRDEARLRHLVGMVGTMNRVAVDRAAEPDEAHDPVNKDAAVKARHAEMRSVAP